MSSESAPVSSARRDELLDRAYAYVLEHGVSGFSLRPLAAAIGSSPRVLLFLFGSKDGLVRALLTRARADELQALGELRGAHDEPRGVGDEAGLASVVATVWHWLADPQYRSLLRLWTDAYAQSLVNPTGPWADFAQTTVEDWLALLAEAQPADSRTSAAAVVERTLALAVLRGAMLDLLATDQAERITAGVERYLGTLRVGPR